MRVWRGGAGLGSRWRGLFFPRWLAGALLWSMVWVVGGCGSEASTEGALGEGESPGEPLGEPLGVVPQRMPWTKVGHRALVGVVDRSKAIVSQDGALALMGHVTPPEKADVIRMVVLPDGHAAEWELEVASPGTSLPRLRAQSGSVAWSADFAGVLVDDSPVTLVRIAATSDAAGASSARVDLQFNVLEPLLEWSGGALVDGARTWAWAWPDAGVLWEPNGAGVSATLPVAPGVESVVWVGVPHERQRPLPAPLPEPDVLYGDAVARWTAPLPAAEIELPDPWWAAAYRASLEVMLLTRDRVEDLYVLKPGALEYNTFWVRDAAYLARAFDAVGLHTEAEKSLRLFWWGPLPDVVNAMGTWGSTLAQKEDGRWEAPDDEWDGTGQVLWALAGHYAFTRDAAWLMAAYPALRAGALWLVNARAETSGDERAPEFGLLPEGYGESLHDWGYIFYHNYWGVLGLREAAAAAVARGAAGDAALFAAEAEEFGSAVRTATLRAAEELGDGGGVIPAAPGASGSRTWGHIAALYPCDVLEHHAPHVSATFERMWQNRMWDLYRFDNNSNKVWTYITLDWAQALLMRGEWQRATALAQGFRTVASPVHGWWEEHFLDSGVGTGDSPHAWAAANYVLWLRNVLVTEESDDTLALLRGVPPTWRVPGSPIRVANLPTTHGRLESMIASTSGDGTATVTVDFTPWPGRAPQMRIYRRGQSMRGVSCSEEMTVERDVVLVHASSFQCTWPPEP